MFGGNNGQRAGNTSGTRARQRDGMRVVILEPNAENRDLLHRGLDELPGFQLVGESVTWQECLSSA